jgi:hypothetical protein
MSCCTERLNESRATTAAMPVISAAKNKNNREKLWRASRQAIFHTQVSLSIFLVGRSSFIL